MMVVQQLKEHTQKVARCSEGIQIIKMDGITEESTVTQVGHKNKDSDQCVRVH